MDIFPDRIHRWPSGKPFGISKQKSKAKPEREDMSHHQEDQKTEGLVYTVMGLDGNADAETQYGHIQHSHGSWWIPGTPGLNGRGKKTVSSRPFWGTWQNTVSKPTGLHSDLVLKVVAPTLSAIPGIPTVEERTNSCTLASTSTREPRPRHKQAIGHVHTH